VTKTFPLMAAQSRNGLFFAERPESVSIWALRETVIEAPNDFAEFSAVRCEVDSVAVDCSAATLSGNP